MNKKLRQDSEKYTLSFDYYIAALCAALCFVYFKNIIGSNAAFTSLDFVNQTNAVTFALIVIGCFFAQIIAAFTFRIKAHIPAALGICSTMFACSLAYTMVTKGGISANNDRISYLLGICFILFIIISWIAKDDKIGLERFKLSDKVLWIIAGVGAAAFTVVVSYVCILKYNSFAVHSFDFGLFAQMFEQMRTTGLANTTVERNVLMSHFGVHFSPFFYILLPFYMIVPRPETLMVIQALFIAAGVFPVLMICKKFELSRVVTIAFIGAYLLFPTLANGALYDFHENKFLTVLLLWTLYFIIADKTALTFVFAALTLSVKEDAAIYIIAIALFMIFTRKQYKKGSIMLIIGAAYFIIAAQIVSLLGEGLMMIRYTNFELNGESGFGAMIKIIVLNLGYLISQIFQPDKISFLLWIFLPVAFAPFMGQRKTTLFLLMPTLVINLMSNWQYQYDVGFQYTYGIAALVIFMTLLAVSEMNASKQLLMSLLSLVFCAVLSCGLFFTHIPGYVEYANFVEDRVADYQELIDTIPTDSSVTADSIMIAHMYYFDELYLYPDYLGTAVAADYLLVSVTLENNQGVVSYLGTEYTLVKSASNYGVYKANR